jgi:predicted SAM-dependent methyltransferase
MVEGAWKSCAIVECPSLELSLNKLHLGCGMRHIPGFLHVDILDAPHIDVQCSIDDLSRFADGSADLIYASHVLEHFGRHEVVGVLKEWCRVLAPGGVLRIAVPDFAAVVNLYEQEGLKDGQSGLVGLVCGGQRNSYDFHKIIFDEPFLTYLFLSTGFHSVRRWDWRETAHSHIDDFSQSYIPHMDKTHGHLMSLNLEASKKG